VVGSLPPVHNIKGQRPADRCSHFLDHVSTSTGRYASHICCRITNDLFDCPVGSWQLAAPLRWRLPATLGYGHWTFPVVGRQGVEP